MWQYIVKRLLLMWPTLIGAALVVFLLMHVVPGDIALLIIGGDQGGDLNPQEVVHIAPCGRTLQPYPLDQGPARGALEAYVPRLILSPSS